MKEKSSASKKKEEKNRRVRMATVKKKAGVGKGVNHHAISTKKGKRTIDTRRMERKKEGRGQGGGGGGP